MPGEKTDVSGLRSSYCLRQVWYPASSDVYRETLHRITLMRVESKDYFERLKIYNILKEFEILN